MLLIIGFDSTAYKYDPNDFAMEVVDYVEGTDMDVDYIDGNDFNNPNNALGRPTIDTTGDGWYITPWDQNVPVVSVYAPFRAYEMVSVGLGGRLILKFNHNVSDDENNPHGIDFIIFGNALQEIGGEDPWLNGDPNNFTIDSNDVIEDDGWVWVSQTGDINEPNDWYKFPANHFADRWAPTFGRIYDPCNPDTNIGTWNLWWGEPTNPLIPLAPNLTPDDFMGETVAYMSQVYGKSAGGSGFDLQWLDANDYNDLAVDPNTGRKWIRYIRIEDDGYYVPEVDAVSDVACCGDYKHPFPAGDIDKNCRVNFYDLKLLADYWLYDITGPGQPANDADIYDDDEIDFKDFSILAQTWLMCTWQCQ